METLVLVHVLPGPQPWRCRGSVATVQGDCAALAGHRPLWRQSGGGQIQSDSLQGPNEALPSRVSATLPGGLEPVSVR